MSKACINRLATALPRHEVHDYFLRFAAASLAGHPRQQALFRKMAGKSGIERRFSCIEPGEDAAGSAVDRDGVFRRGAFPGTATRMDMYEKAAADLAMRAIDRLELGRRRDRITHLIVASCTGFSAPGLDLEIVHRAGLSPCVERTLIGFMGCYAAINALKLAHHIVRSEPEAQVLVVNCELTTLHLKETDDLEQLLTFCLWGDGCSAALVTSEQSGIRLDRFKALLAREAREFMTWSVRDDGFDMVLSGRDSGGDPDASRRQRRRDSARRQRGRDQPLGRAPGRPFGARCGAAHPEPLARCARSLARGAARQRQLSSATVMFVLEKMLEDPEPGAKGCGMAFGLGLTAETMTFGIAS